MHPTTRQPQRGWSRPVLHRRAPTHGALRIAAITLHVSYEQGDRNLVDVARHRVATRTGGRTIDPPPTPRLAAAPIRDRGHRCHHTRERPTLAVPRDRPRERRSPVPRSRPGGPPGPARPSAAERLRPGSAAQQCSATPRHTYRAAGLRWRRTGRLVLRSNRARAPADPGAANREQEARPGPYRRPPVGGRLLRHPNAVPVHRREPALAAAAIEFARARGAGGQGYAMGHPAGHRSGGASCTWKPEYFAVAPGMRQVAAPTKRRGAGRRFGFQAVCCQRPRSVPERHFGTHSRHRRARPRFGSWLSQLHHRAPHRRPRPHITTCRRTTPSTTSRAAHTHWHRRARGDARRVGGGGAEGQSVGGCFARHTVLIWSLANAAPSRRGCRNGSALIDDPAPIA